VQIGVGALEMLGSAQLNPNIQEGGRLRPLWPEARVQALSHHPSVSRVICMGTVLAVELVVAEGEAGYASGVARTVTTRLRGKGVYARPLGNVVYVMVTPTSSPATTQGLLDALDSCL